MFDARELIDLLIMGWMSNVPLAIGSVITLAVFFDRVSKFRGLESKSRDLATSVIERIVKPDLDGARRLCDDSALPIAHMMGEALRWQNVAVEDLSLIHI